MQNGKKQLGKQMRIIHRYLGFFLVGIMAVYAVSGIIMVFRNTDFLKHKVIKEQQLEPGLTAGELSPILRMRVKTDRQEGDTFYFQEGQYNSKTGLAIVTKMELPYLFGKMEKLHKATTDSPLFFLNIFFGLSLLFFVISSFWMFLPKTTIFKNGLYFTLAGMALTLILIFI